MLETRAFWFTCHDRGKSLRRLASMTSASQKPQSAAMARSAFVPPCKCGSRGSGQIVRTHRAILAPGERALLPVLAQTKEQAANCFGFVTGVFAASPLLRHLVEGQTSDTLMLASGLDIVVRPASFRSSRGSTMIGVIADETAWWRSDNSSNPDVEILRALRPGLLTTKGPLIAISSPYSRRGELWRNYLPGCGAG